MQWAVGADAGKKAPQFGGTSAISGGRYGSTIPIQARAQGKAARRTRSKPRKRSSVNRTIVRTLSMRLCRFRGAKRWRSSKRGAVKYSLRPCHRTIILMSRAPLIADARWRSWSTTDRQLGDPFATFLHALRRGCCCWRHDGQPRGYPAFSGDTPLAALVIAAQSCCCATRATSVTRAAPAGDGQRLNCPHGHHALRKGR